MKKLKNRRKFESIFNTEKFGKKELKKIIGGDDLVEPELRMTMYDSGDGKTDSGGDPGKNVE
jgi:hypothetical protein